MGGCIPRHLRCCRPADGAEEWYSSYLQLDQHMSPREFEEGKDSTPMFRSTPRLELGTIYIDRASGPQAFVRFNTRPPVPLHHVHVWCPAVGQGEDGVARGPTALPTYCWYGQTQPMVVAGNVARAYDVLFVPAIGRAGFLYLYDAHRMRRSSRGSACERLSLPPLAAEMHDIIRPLQGTPLHDTVGWLLHGQPCYQSVVTAAFPLLDTPHHPIGLLEYMLVVGKALESTTVAAYADALFLNGLAEEEEEEDEKRSACDGPWAASFAGEGRHSTALRPAPRCDGIPLCLPPTGRLAQQRKGALTYLPR